MKKIVVSLIVFLSAFGSVYGQAANPQNGVKQDKKWWKEAIIYQLYPRSFMDSNGDGIGDLQGVISRLDYIKSLGVTAVWFNPVYSSPNDDNGYDISNYRDIMKDFGTMDDFNQLMKGLHDRGIKIVMDLVVNHSSDEHEWFKQSRSSRTNPYRDYYHWWPAERGKPAYRWSHFDVNSDAWAYDSLTNAYYLHYFSPKQPDLNWENPKLRQEVYSIMKFWLDKGIDGFRMDAFQYVAKDTTFPAFPKGYEKQVIRYYGMVAGIHGYLQEMNREVLSKYDIMTVSEGVGSTLEDAHAMVDADRHELNMGYHFEAALLGSPKGYNLPDLKRVFTKWDSAFVSKGWISVFLANHDQPRMLSKYGNDTPQFREFSSKMLSTFVLSMRGTPYCYNGDEIGMSNIYMDKIEDYRDVDALNGYKNCVNHGGDVKEYMERMQLFSRDNSRTPFQWSNKTNAGFTTGKPWLKINPNYSVVNAAAQEKDPNSVLNYFRNMVKFRKNNPILVYGDYQLLDAKNPKVYAYVRKYEGRRLLVLLNFSTTNSVANTGLVINTTELKITNYKEKAIAPDANGQFELRPYEADIYELK
jgi:oligo-1,6-glucosidase